MRKYAYLKEPLHLDDGGIVYKIMYYATPEEIYLFEYDSPDAVLCSADLYYDSLNDLREGMYGIREPDEALPCSEITENTVCIVPGLAFTPDGGRLGYGGGYYDRFLSDYSGTSIGLCYSELLFDSLPSEEYDIAVDIIITDSLAVS